MSAKRDSGATLDVADKMEEQIEMNNAASETLNLSREPSGSGLETLDTSRSLSGFTPSTTLQTKDTHRIDPKRWCGLCRGYVRQDWDTIIVEDGVDELRAGWIELFFDLIFVAAIIHIASTAVYQYKKGSTYFLLTVFAQFAMLLLLWREQVMYESRFVMNQTIDDIIRFIFMLFIFYMYIFHCFPWCSQMCSRIKPHYFMKKCL